MNGQECEKYLTLKQIINNLFENFHSWVGLPANFITIKHWIALIDTVVGQLEMKNLCSTTLYRMFVWDLLFLWDYRARSFVLILLFLPKTSGEFCGPIISNFLLMKSNFFWNDRCVNAKFPCLYQVLYRFFCGSFD